MLHTVTLSPSWGYYIYPSGDRLLFPSQLPIPAMVEEHSDTGGEELIHPDKQEILTRLQGRAREDESIEDVIERLLDKTKKDVGLKPVIRNAIDEYESVCCVYVNHPTKPEEPPTFLDIAVYSDEAEAMMDYADIWGPEYRIIVRKDDGELRRLQFRVYGTIDGPQSKDTREGTPVYMDDDVIGAEPIPLKEGIERLREKITETNHEFSSSL